MTTETTDVKTRPGGRSARIRADVHRAVQELAAEMPGDGLTIPVIAARAGVHPTTVYRRWRTVGELLAAVATSRFTDDLVVPDTGTLRGDLEQWVTDVATDLADPDSLGLMRLAVGIGGEDGGCACVADRNAQLQAMADRERARGGLDLSTELLADLLLGPLYYRVLFTRVPADPAWAVALVDQFPAFAASAEAAAPA